MLRQGPVTYNHFSNNTRWLMTNDPNNCQQNYAKNNLDLRMLVGYSRDQIMDENLKTLTSVRLSIFN